MRRWYEAYPGRLEYELERLAERGLSFTVDEQHLERAGLVVLNGTLPHEDQEIELQVAFPDSFPFMRPEVFAPGLSLGRHQNPVERNLCLLERSSRAWSVEDTVAWLVAERVPHLLGLLQAGGEVLRQGEAPQGEPENSYIAGEPGSVVFIPQEMLTISSEHTVGILKLATGINEPPQKLLRACLSKVSVRQHQGDKRTLAEVSSPLAERFAGRTLDGRWARLARLPEASKPRDLMAAITRVQPELAKPRWQRLPDGGEMSILGVVAPVEVEQGVWQDAWLFVVGLRDSPRAAMSIYTARGERLVAEELRARLPAGTALNKHTVGLVGLGSLGAPLAAELLHAQVGELRLMDFDRVEAGNIVRWTHGISAVGHQKTAVIGGWAAGEYPFTRVGGFEHRIGAVAAPDAGASPRVGVSESEGMGSFLDGLDVVVDAAAELGVQHLLSTLAHELRLPQIFAWGSEGGWGGAVACFTPGEGGCWLCLQMAFEDGTIELPAAGPDPPFQPRGCDDPTFAAPGFALTPIAAQAARVTARLLAGERSGVVHVCTMRDVDGELPAPRWVTSTIPHHEGCPCAHQLANV